MAGSERLRLPPLLDSTGEPDLAGRAHELDVLDGVWDEVMGGRRQVVFIGGGPGVGKTRLAAESAAAAYSQGALVAHGRCFPDHGVPFEPFIEALGPVLTSIAGGGLQAGDDDAIELLRRFVGDHEAPMAEATPRARGALFDGVSSVLSTLAESQPFVLVIDDVHWATPPTLDLLTHVVRTVIGARLLILVTFRTTLPERSVLLTRVIADLYRQRAVGRLDLEGLTVEDTASFLIRQSGHRGSHVLEVANILRDQTGGNPFFLREVLRAVEATAGVGDITSAMFAMPSSVADAIRLRREALAPDQREVLRLAALAGSEVDIDVVVAAADRDVADVLDALEAAVDVGLFTARTESGYAFVHELARQAVVDATPAAARSAMHAKLAAAMEARYGDTPGMAQAIAHHYVAAGIPQHRSKAVSHLQAAARFAATRLAFEEAAELLERAARLEAADASREQLQLAAADYLVKSGAFRDAQRLYGQVAASADPVRRAQAAIGFEDAGWRPGLSGHEAIDKLREADRRLDPERFPGLHVEVRSSLSRALEYSGVHEEAQEIGDQALAKARELGDPRLIALALHRPIANVPIVSTTYMDRSREAAELSHRLNDADLTAQIAFTAGTTAYALGLPDEWDAATRDLAASLDRSGQPFHRAAIATSTAARLFMRGDFAATEAALGPLLELSGTFGDDPLDGLHGAATFMVHRETGLDDVRPLITGDPANEPGTWRLGLLALYTEFGMVDAATHVLDELMQTAYAAMAAEKHHGTAAAFLSDAIMLVGSTSHARRLYDVLLPRSGTNLLTGHFVCVWGSADRYLGMLAGLCGEDAEPHFEMALAMDRKMASIVHEAETLARYAGFLHDRDRRLSTECAMRAEQLAASIGSGRAHRILEPRRTDGQPLLTPREIEVLGQIALGASNREIAERLFISAHTAANHVRNILTKTGARNRTQAVRIATDAGLLH